jgi:hypothetical protein
MLTKKPQRALAPLKGKRGKRGAATRLTAAKWRQIIEELDERLEQKRFAWLSRPRLHTAIFEEFWRDEELARECAKSGVAIDAEAFERQRSEHKRKIEEATKDLGWSNERLFSFTQLVVAYRRNPTIEDYLRVRYDFPEVEIQVGYFGGIDPLFALEDDFKKQGIEPNLVAAALDSDEPCVDELSLRLLELLAAREKLPTDGPRNIQMRRDAISDATVNYLIVTMLESFDWHEEEFRIPASLVVLIRHQFCGERPDLLTTYLSKEHRNNMALTVAQYLKPGEKLSINKLVQMTGLKRPTAARWLKQGFSTEVVRWQRLMEKGGL